MLKISDLNTQAVCSSKQFLSSGTEFAECRDDSVDCVGGMVEGRDVAGAPRELSANSGEDTVLVVVFWSEVSDFLLGSGKLFSAWHKPYHFEETHLLEVTNVAHGFELVEVTCVMDEVEHEVVLHGNVKRLQLLSTSAAPADRSIHCILRLHELFVLAVDFVHNTRSVNALLEPLPVDWLRLLNGRSVKVVEYRLQLRVGILSISSCSGVINAS